jgi:aryl sulfotransferase
MTSNRLATTEYRSFVSDSRRWGRYEHRPGDIVVCTPPKCGTTWTQTIVSNLIFPDGNLPAPVFAVAPWLDARFVPLEETLANLDAQTHRRSLKTHTPADAIPWYTTAAYIVVGRGGLDAFMSFTNHIANMRPDRVMSLIESAIAEGIDLEGGFQPSPDIHEMFASWLDDGLLFNFMSSYWELRNDANVLFVHYDDLSADLASESRRIADFLGIDVEARHWPGILERCSFNYMKQHSAEIAPFDDLFVGGGDTFFFKGTNGRWRDTLTDDEVAAYSKRAAGLLPADALTWLDRGDVS